MLITLFTGGWCPLVRLATVCSLRRCDVHDPPWVLPRRSFLLPSDPNSPRDVPRSISGPPRRWSAERRPPLVPWTRACPGSPVPHSPLPSPPQAPPPVHPPLYPPAPDACKYPGPVPRRQHCRTPQGPWCGRPSTRGGAQNAGGGVGPGRKPRRGPEAGGGQDSTLSPERASRRRGPSQWLRWRRRRRRWWWWWWW